MDMKIGAVYPQIELGGRPEALARFATGIETLGFDHILLYDHVVGAVHEHRQPPLTGPYTQNDPFHDPLVAFAFLAGITKRIEMITGILILPQRQTVLAAKQATDVQLFSGGRLVLGVGVGWNYVEYDALGEDFHVRGARLNEQIVYLRRLWSEPVVSFDGAFDKIDRACIVPRPDQTIPIYCGGFSEAGYRRGAKLADGFIFTQSLEGSALPGWSRVRALLAEQGRPIEGFGANYMAMGEGARGLSVNDIADKARRRQDAGGTHLSIVTMGRGFKTAEQHIDHLAGARQLLAGLGLADARPS
jgi:probable F420-dependent oxidoreductase